MAVLNTTTFAAALKTLYSKEKVRNVVYDSNPFLAMVPKMTNFTGDGLKIPILWNDPVGLSADFATAQSNQSSSSQSAFTLTRVKEYGVAVIDGELIEASKGNEGAFLEATKREIDGVLHGVARRISIGLYRDRAGSIGQISAGSNVGTATITLANPEEIVNFYVGQKLVASATEGNTGGLRSAGATVTLTAVDRDAGTLTASGNWSAGIAAVAASDYLFTEGDQTGTASANKVAGLSAWVPSSAPGATTFFGVDRSVDTDRLGGVRVDGSSLNIAEALMKGCARLAREGAKPDVIFMPFDQYLNLINYLGSKVQFVDLKAGGVGFQALLVHAPHGAVKVVPDGACKPGRAFALQMDTWKLASLGECPHILDADGNRMLRQSTADQYEVRVGAYYQLGCYAPGYNANITLP